jgi:hypothetical protein
LFENKFIVKPDLRPLQYLQTQAHLSRIQARWVLILQDFHFNLEYVSGASKSAVAECPPQDIDPKIPLGVVLTQKMTHQCLIISFTRAKSMLLS